MIPWAQGRCLTCDVTSPDTLAASHLAESAVRAGSAATKAKVAKTAKNTEIAITHAFVPLAFESLGALGGAMSAICLRSRPAYHDHYW